jgi:hypothetical protein
MGETPFPIPVGSVVKLQQQYMRITDLTNRLSHLDAQKQAAVAAQDRERVTRLTSEADKLKSELQEAWSVGHNILDPWRNTAELKHLFSVWYVIGVALGQVWPVTNGDSVPTGRLPRFWRLFRYLLPPETRERVFDPAFNDLLEIHAVRCSESGKGAKRWLGFCFTFHMLRMVANCFGATLSDKASAMLRKLWLGLALWWWLRR